MMVKKLIQTVIQVIIILFVSNAWGGCETERDLVLEYLKEIGDPQKNAPNIINQYKSAQGNRVKDPVARRQYEGWIADKEKQIEAAKINAPSARTELEKIIYRHQINALYPFQLCLLRLRLEVGTDLDISPSTQGQQSVYPSLVFDSQDKPQQTLQLAQQNQKHADQQRQGKRKTNDPAAQAHECVEIDKAGSGNFGAFKNICGYKVNFTTCNYKPRTIQGGFNWSADFNCEKNQYGLHTPDGGRSVAAHNRNTEMVYWFACKAPATPVDAAFVVGKGIEARCHN